MNREELIQAYVSNKLGKEEKAEFDRLFENDPEFRKEVEFHKDLKAVFADLERKRIKTKLQNFESELKTGSQKSYAPWLVAASILVLVGIGILTMFNNPANSDQLYMAYFEPYENVVQPITRGQSIESMKTEVFISYEKKAYKKAAAGFQQLYETTGESYYLLYQANALMADGQPQKAVPLLKQHLAAKDAFAEKSRWYLALAYLKTNETKKAKIVLRNIVAGKTYKADDAKEILKELE